MEWRTRHHPHLRVFSRFFFSMMKFADIVVRPVSSPLRSQRSASSRSSSCPKARLTRPISSWWHYPNSSPIRLPQSQTSHRSKTLHPVLKLSTSMSSILLASLLPYLSPRHVFWGSNGSESTKRTFRLLRRMQFGFVKLVSTPLRHGKFRRFWHPSP